MNSSSRDTVIEALAGQLEKTEGAAIWLADEQASSPALDHALKKSEVTYVSNRIDQTESMQRKGVKADFHDFDFQSAVETYDHLFIRVPKQRSLIHHLLNVAPDILVAQGSLWIAGQKSEGIKTHVRRAELRLGAKAEKIKSAKGVELYRLEFQSVGDRLEDDSYGQLRQVEMAPDMTYWSKPGIYGWNKIDQGSQALVEVLREIYVDLNGKCVLDLGCGYGYLASQALLLGPDLLVASDNHAGAVQATRKNLPATKSQIEVVAADCGSSINKTFDLILCNPPFHQGFDVTPAMHKKFFQAIARLLAVKGKALVVLNSFLKVDRLCQEVGLNTLNTWHFEDTGFRVFELAARGKS